MERRVVVDGDYCMVQCAVLRDGSTPAWDYLDQIKRGMWEADPNHDDFPSDEQIHDYAKLLRIVRDFANTGYPPHRTAINHLEEGVWEFKHGAMRVSFFDTPGDGTYEPKLPIEDISLVEDPPPGLWHIPEFDLFVRLGHCFGKTGRFTEPQDIKRSLTTREEDVSHDQQDC